MGDKAQHLIAGLFDGLQSALLAIQAPGFLDKAGAFAIGLFVVACLLLAPAS